MLLNKQKSADKIRLASLKKRMHTRRVFAFLTLGLFGLSAQAANPFLDAPDDRPAFAEFRGREWGENIPEDDLALSARVVTTRLAKMPWGAIFKIEFTDLKSRAKEHRESGRNILS